MGPAEQLRAGLEQLPGIEAGDGQIALLIGYLDLLRQWNRTYNLTAITDPSAMVTRHLLDALSVSPHLDPGRLLDAGTGGGLPGVPLAIVRPDLEVTLLDSAGKKIRFLNHVRRSLQLQNIHPVQARLERYGAEDGFNGIISRAFSSLEAFAVAARPLLTERTKLFAMKGRYPEAELEALPRWIRLVAVEKLQVPGLQEDRHLVIMSVNP